MNKIPKLIPLVITIPCAGPGNPNEMSCVNNNFVILKDGKSRCNKCNKIYQLKNNLPKK